MKLSFFYRAGQGLPLGPPIFLPTLENNVCPNSKPIRDIMILKFSTSLVTNYGNSRRMDCDELAEFLDEAIDEYMSDGNPEECCKKLEKMLSGTFKYSLFEEPFRFNFQIASSSLPLSQCLHCTVICLQSNVN